MRWLLILMGLFGAMALVAIGGALLGIHIEALPARDED